MSADLRQWVRQRAGSRCEYCRFPDAAPHLMRFHLEHIRARRHDGTEAVSNLAWACARCNVLKGTDLSGVDPDSNRIVRLFHPRRDQWPEHFHWIQNGEIIEGRTPIGRATVIALGLNRPLLVAARREWVGVGWHPPNVQRRVRRRPR